MTTTNKFIFQLFDNWTTKVVCRVPSGTKEIKELRLVCVDPGDRVLQFSFPFQELLVLGLS